MDACAVAALAPVRSASREKRSFHPPLGGALSRIEIRFESGAKVRTVEKVAMWAGKSVLNHRPRALRFSDPCIELAKLGFREAGPWSAATSPSCKERTDFTKCEPGILAES
jgi:hypothetical protein